MKEKIKTWLRKIKDYIKKLLMKTAPAYRTAKFVFDRVSLLESNIDRVLINLRNELRLLDSKYEMLYWFMINKGDLSSTEEKKKLFKCFECPSQELREKQLESAKLLKRFKEVCEANGLVYWLEGGTLLGAIRHDGFIPWDDDIDVNMPVEDMFKLKSIVDGSDEFLFRNKYNYYLGCIVPGITTVVDSDCWVDIFPMKVTDCTCLGRKETENQINEYSKEMRSILREELVMPQDAPDEFIDMEDKEDERVRFINETMEKYCAMIPEGPKPNSCYRSLTAHNSPGGGNLFMLYDIFPLTTAEFEGERYAVPKNYNMWLTTYYGDFYHVPLNRVPKHFT